jgi:hypothetical protein
MSLGTVFKVAAGAAASCAAVHIGFVYFGLEPYLHALGHALPGAAGVDAGVHACGVDHAFDLANNDVGVGDGLPVLQLW